MRKTIAFVLLSSALLLQCGKGKEAEKSDSAGDEKKVEFVAPADSSVSVAQMRGWIACNPLLDSLAYLYQDSFKTEDAAARLKYQEEFMQAQDEICVRAGLSGGYEEYRWILVHAGHPRNKAVLESAGVDIP